MPGFSPRGLWERWLAWQGGSVNRRIFAAAAAVGALTVAVKFAGFVKELLVARQFGTGDALDAFLIALLLPTFASNVMAGALGSAFVPACARTGEGRGDSSPQAFLSGTLLVTLTAFSILTMLLALAGRPLLALVASGFDPGKLDLAQSLFLVLLPSLLLSAVAALWSGLLNFRRRFALAAVSPAFVPLAVAAALLTGGRSAGVGALATGTLAGLLLQVAALAWGVKRQGFSLAPRWHGLTPPLRQFIDQFLPMAGTLLLLSSADLVDQSMAAMLGAGSVAALVYGGRVVSVVLGLTSMALSTAVLPHFSEMAARSDWKALRHTLRTCVRYVFLLTVPVALALMLLSEPLARLIFERGAFTADDTRVVARVQSFLALQIPFYALVILGARLLNALGRNVVLLRIGLASTIANVAGNALLMRRLGVAGIALSTSLVIVLSAVWMGIAVASEARRRGAPRLAPPPVQGP